MGYGGWREVRDFRFPADAVFEHLIGVLQQVGCEIDSTDAIKRGVVAHRGAVWSLWRRNVSASRVAVRADDMDDGTTRVTIESAPAFAPQMFGENAHRRRVEEILNLLQQSMDA